MERMRYKPFILILLYCFFFLTGSLFGIGEKTIVLGSTASWGLVEKLQGVTVAPDIRPSPVLVLSDRINSAVKQSDDFFARDENFLDLHLSFDEGHPGRFSDYRGNYNITVSPELGFSGAPLNRSGAGAAVFSGSGSEPLILKPKRTALFAPGSYVRDFSIEFWLFPQNQDNGEQILSWTASKADSRGDYIHQSVQCVISKNRLNWTFSNFFFAPGEAAQKFMSISGPTLLNRTWSHHLIRFDADLGLLEYLVDGRVEVIEYTTRSGREGSEVYTPVIGENCRIVLGGRFSGMMDDFSMYRCFLKNAALTKYSELGGRVETRTLDLGNEKSRVIKIEAFGGRTRAPGAESFRVSSSAGRVVNEYAGNGTLRFQDYSEINLFIRLSNSPYRWNDVPWIPVKAGAELAGTFSGRFLQIAADFYPGEDCETSPYLSELRVLYNAAEPPAPPAQVIAAAKDGAVELSWRGSISRDVEGYLVYYGTASGEYFGDYSLVNSPSRFSSPIDAGNRTSFRIDGLKNGTLYYFAVAAYSRFETLNGVIVLPQPGEFSRETAARPLRMAE